MIDVEKDLKSLDNWRETTKGTCIYQVSPCVYYELQLVHWWTSQDMASATANIYLTRIINSLIGELLTRDLLLTGLVTSCLNKAAKNYAEMNEYWR